MNEQMGCLRVGWVALVWLTRILVRWVPQLVAAAWKAMMHPENEREWRFAYMYFWVPLGKIVFGIVIAWMFAVALRWLAPLNWLVMVVWVIYYFVVEPLGYYVYSDEGWKVMDAFVDGREYEPVAPRFGLTLREILGVGNEEVE